MKLQSLFSTLALSALAAPAFAAPSCANTFSLGSLTVNDSVDYWRVFFTPQSFTDCYQFELVSLSDTSVISTTWDLSFRLNISLDSVSLSGGSLGSEQFLSPAQQDGYTFAGLQAGQYVLAVGGEVVDNGTKWPSYGVGYGVAVATQSPVTPVPEPESLAMLAMGLGIVGWGARRKA
jgi:hypothetical protein